MVIYQREKSFIRLKSFILNPQYYQKYEKELTLDRVDINKGYNQENCRWATYQTQANNTRTNKYITYNKEVHTLAEWCRILEKPYSTMSDRLKSGWNVEDTFTKLIKTNKTKK